MEVFCNGVSRGVILPCAGLRLRRPAREVFAVRIREPGEKAPRDLFFPGAGWNRIATAGGHIPVWVHNDHLRPFSLEMDQGSTRDGRRLLATLLYDISLPLEVKIGFSKTGTRMHREGEWVFQQLASREAGKALSVSLGDVTLVAGNVKRWLSGEPGPAASIHATRLLHLTAVAGRPFTLPAESCREWYTGPVSGGEVAAEALQFDVWSQTPQELIRQLGPGPTAVLVVLDRASILSGLGPAGVRTRMHSYNRALTASGSAILVLALGPELDLTVPLERRYAEEFIRISEESGCPLLDLRRIKR